MMQSDRKAYIAAFVTEEVRDAAKAEARRKKVSVSRLIHEILLQVLLKA